MFDLTDQVHNLSAVLQGDAGLLPALITWIGLARFLLKVINSWVESFFTGILNNFPENSIVRKWALGITDSLWYAILHYTANWLLSISLPKFENLNKPNEKQTP